MQVIIKGTAETEFHDEARLHGVDCQDNFADYFHDQDLKDAVESGYMDFRYEDGKLWTYTTYETNRILTDSELVRLADYTQGQWSDGIGEGFEQYPCAEFGGEEVYLSPWHTGQKLQLQQIDGENAVSVVEPPSMSEMIKELEKASYYEGTEVGEYWAALTTLSRYTYLMDPDLEENLFKTITEEYLRLKTGWEWVEETTTHTSTHKTLNYKG